MTWFRVDDSFYDHPKTRAIDPKRLPDAVYVWTMAGCYCARHLTDGSISRTSLKAVCNLFERRLKAVCDELVRVNLWEFDGVSYKFRDWHDYQPTRSSVLDSREKAKIRKAENRARHAVTQMAGVVTETPTRPDPTRPDPDLKREQRVAAAAELVEPYPEPTPIAPAPARVRGALVRGYRDAFEAHAGSLATDVRPETADDAVRAVLARASVTERDPVELAAGCARAWFGLNASRWRGLPRWDWFLRDVGAVLADARPATATEHATETGEEIQWAM